MFRLKILLSLSILALPVSPAIAQTPIIFENDGDTFRYTSELHGDYVYIVGSIVENGERFNLTVKPNRRVVGDFGGRPVKFSVSKRTHDRLIEKLTKETSVVVAVASPR